MGEFAPFYTRHPHWSLMGRMVEDTTRAVDALAADAAIDPERISVFGYTIGGTGDRRARGGRASQPRRSGVIQRAQIAAASISRPGQAGGE
jgi:hypothetical protein